MLTSIAAKGAPIKSMLGGYGADNSFGEQQNPNPYIRDGLIATWDGEWNVGFGEHDAESTTWVDLTGNGHDWALTSNYSWGEDFLNITGKCGTGE